MCCGRDRLVWLESGPGVGARSALVRLALCRGRPVVHAGIASISIRARVPLSGSYRGISGFQGTSGQSFHERPIIHANGTGRTGVSYGTSHGTFSRRPWCILPPELRATGPGGAPANGITLAGTDCFPSSTAVFASAVICRSANDNDTLTAQMPAGRHGWNIERIAHARRRSRSAGPRCCATAIPRLTQVPPASSFEYQFHHPEIIAVDSALMVDPGSYRCHNTPRKPDPPRHWDQRD